MNDRLISADKLKVDMDSTIDFGSFDNRLMILDQIDSAPTIKAIPLDLIKQAREEMAAYIESATGQWTSGYNNGVNNCIEILDKLIESRVDNG